MDMHSDLWKLLEREPIDGFATFEAWARGSSVLNANQCAYYLGLAAKGSWVVDTFATFKALKARGVQYIGKALPFPEARTMGDLFDAARLIPHQTGGNTFQEHQHFIAKHTGGEGFVFASGSRANGAAPTCHIGGVRKRTATGGRYTSGAFHLTYAKPNAAVLACWGDCSDDPQWSLGTCEFIEREDGLLVVGRAHNGFSNRWLALLDKGETLTALWPQIDRDAWAANEALERAAWGDQWRVCGSDRQAGALGTSDVFAVTVEATDRDSAQDAARAARYALGREHVLITSAYRADVKPEA